ncbi:MAG: hydroxyproline-2-epimerase [Woeseia sp.]|nr:proline racemase family protein [Woeseia sp.]NNE62043.1 hydroxyproline-2-epimerase [Woeseia sp.]NNL54095.1 hydroxyproline-2-epimerase [Woeseia sp.]
MQTIDVIDSHTGGEPTRVVMRGAPALRATSLADAVRELREEHDDFRRSVINEPRGSEILVGALVLPAFESGNAAAVVFFNNATYLGMCGHGMIGVAITLAAEGTLEIGTHSIETPAGSVSVTLHTANRVSIDNVESFRLQKNVKLEVPGIGAIHGDIAWGGNWFFLVTDHGQLLVSENVDALVTFTVRIRAALDKSTLRGTDGAVIDHIELCGPPSAPALADSRNFVLCPGKEYDRSPCGTGTSARLACLLEDGELEPGQVWRQESITGSVFEAKATVRNGRALPTISGDAYLTARATLLYDPRDPLKL